MPCCNHSHRETRKSVWMCAESTATVIVRGGHHGTVLHALAHTKQRPQPAEQKQRGEENDPKSRQHLHTWRASCSRVAISARGASPRPAVAKASLQSTVQILIFCVLEKQEKGGDAQEGKSIQQEAQLDDSDTCGTASTLTITVGGSTHHPQKTKGKKAKQKKRKNTPAGVWLCVWRCGCLPALTAIKQKTRGKEMCAPPHRPSSHAHTSRLP
ncbi:hypothetical protein TCSYLVIO_011087, partial [Trypanosoma cruzi]